MPMQQGCSGLGRRRKWKVHFAKSQYRKSLKNVFVLFSEHLDKSNNTMANAVNGEVEEDGENRGQAEEEMEEGTCPSHLLLSLHILNRFLLLHSVPNP